MVATQTIFDQKHYLELIETRGEIIRRVVPKLVDACKLSTALDIGCGLGFFSQTLSDCKLQVTGVDGREANVAEARRRFPPITFHQADVEDPHVVDLGTYDLVLCFGLLYHLENPLRAIRHIHSMTRKVLFLESMCIPGQQQVAALRHEPRANDQSLTDLAFYPSESCIVRMLYRSGFRFVYCAPPADHDDFRETTLHFRRRTVLCASFDPLNMKALAYVAEPMEDHDPWMKPSGFRQLLPRVRSFLAKPTKQKVESITFRVRRVLAKKREVMNLPFGAKWLLEDSSLDGQLRAGEFETAEMQFVASFLREGMTVLDIGAHHGLYTLLASKLVGERGRVFAFEPSRRERRRLQRHIRLNQCKNVTVQPFALGSANGEADFFLVRGAEDYCNSLRPPLVQAETRRVRVEMRTLNDFVRSAEVRHVDFIKLDVEGAELDVLKGANKVLSYKRPPIFLIEVYDVRSAAWGYRAREIVKFLSERGYQWYGFGDNGDLRAIPSDSESYDANLLAIPAERLREVR